MPVIPSMETGMAGYGYLRGQYPPGYDKQRYRDRYDAFSPQDMYQAWAQSGQPMPVDPESVYANEQLPTQGLMDAPQAAIGDPCAGLTGVALIQCQNAQAAGMDSTGALGGGSPLPAGGLLNY
jgi:hypothetical protein